MKTNPIQIRAYRPSDFERLKEIHDPARKNELRLAGLSKAFLPLSIAAEREELFSYTLFVAEYDGVAAGFTAITEDELAWLYVDVRYARRGIGKALVEFALAHMENEVSLEVLAGNTPAVALYTACGFKITETISGVMPGNESFPVTVHVMRRTR